MIQANLIKYGIYLLVLAVVCAGLYAFGNHDGRQHVQRLWDAKKLEILQATNKAVAERLAENEKIRLQNVNDLEKVTKSYESKLHNRPSALSRGLYVSKTTCSDTAAMPTALPPPTGLNGAAAILRLPDSVEQSLRAIADDANVCTIRLKELQDWESKQ